MNSVEDIIRDRTVLQRERNLDVRIGYYVAAKFLTLCVFSALQCTLFVIVGNSILEVRGMFFEYFLWTFLTAVSGIALGSAGLRARAEFQDRRDARAAHPHSAADLRWSA